VVTAWCFRGFSRFFLGLSAGERTRTARMKDEPSKLFPLNSPWPKIVGNLFWESVKFFLGLYGIDTVNPGNLPNPLPGTLTGTRMTSNDPQDSNDRHNDDPSMYHR
jgi:hypothetical protein